MGSTGTDRFGDYHPRGDGMDCYRPIESIWLEDVALCEYYLNHGGLPLPGTEIMLNEKLVKGRLVVRVSTTGEILGSLPTRYHYLLLCVKNDVAYAGSVTSSAKVPVPCVEIEIHAY